MVTITELTKRDFLFSIPNLKFLSGMSKVCGRGKEYGKRKIAKGTGRFVLILFVNSL